MLPNNQFMDELLSFKDQKSGIFDQAVGETADFGGQISSIFGEIEGLREELSKATEKGLGQKGEALKGLAGDAERQKVLGKIDLGTSLAGQAIGAYFVKKSYDKRLKEEKAKIEREVVPIGRTVDVAKDLSAGLGSIGKRSTRSAAREAAETGAASAASSLAMAGEGISSSAGMQKLARKALTGMLEAERVGKREDTQNAMQRDRVMSNAARVMGQLKVAERSSAITMHANIFANAHNLAQQEADEMARTITGIQQIFNFGLAVAGLPTGAAPASDSA